MQFDVHLQSLGCDGDPTLRARLGPLGALLLVRQRNGGEVL